MYSRPIDSVCGPLADGLDQPRIIGGIVFQVGVLKKHDIAGRMFNPGAQRSAFTPVFRVIKWPQMRISCSQLTKDLPAPISGMVVNRNQLGNAGLLNDSPDDLRKRGTFVENRHDDRNL
jgi:hypothetical protein